ncbi:MAG: hypothetical protein QM704_00200 [Anaeromyxobacteraceae bacterium]
MRPLRLPAASVALVLAACGGGGGGGPGPGGQSGGNLLAATVGGQAWVADAFTVGVIGASTPSRDGTILVTGTRGSDGTSIALNLGFMPGPATQPLGVNFVSTPGGTGAAIFASKTYLTPLDGASGFVTITERTATHLAGTFHFTAAEPAPGTGTLQVTSGAFDVTDAGGLPPLPTGVGSTVIATLGGAPWNAATIVGSSPAAGTLALAAGNTAYTLVLTPKVALAAGASYGIPSKVNLQVNRTGAADAWSGGDGADVGTLTVTTLAADRLVATFSATLPPVGAGAALTVTGGAANVHLQQ